MTWLRVRVPVSHPLDSCLKTQTQSKYWTSLRGGGHVWDAPVRAVCDPSGGVFERETLGFNMTLALFLACRSGGSRPCCQLDCCKLIIQQSY